MIIGLKIAGLVVLNILIYLYMGQLFSTFVNINYSVIEKIVLGFFLHFSLFQCVAVPMILGQKSVSMLLYIWVIVTGGLFLAGIQYLRKKERIFVRKENFVLNVNKILILVLLFIIVLQIYYMVRNEYNGWDTAYYIGTMNTAIKTDSMYIYNGNDGTKETMISLRYALSGFYMYGVVLCRIFKIHVLLYCRYIIPIILSIISNMILFEIGHTTARKNNSNYALVFVIIANILNFSFISTYSTSEFLLTRGAEAKGYCSNIIIPAIFLMAVHLNKDWKNKKYWIFLFIICLACNAISVSSILLVPVLVSIIALGLIVSEKNMVIFRRYIMVMIIPTVYVIVYILFSKNVIRIWVK